MRTPGNPRDYVVLYRTRSRVTGMDVYLATPEWPHGISSSQSQAHRFGHSAALEIAKKNPVYDDSHHQAEVVEVPRSSTGIPSSD